MDLMKAKKFFSKPKEDPLFKEKQLKIKQLLLKNLSRAVKETQLLFTRAEKGVINDCRPVQRLCAKFEDTLRHGLKAGWFSSSNKPPTFWPVVLKISRKQAIEYINRLQYAQTDNGKCRAWIRLAVNECSLESYINVLCNDTDLLNYYYEPHAFLRDEEVVSPLCQLLAGLSQISFNVTVDTASLEFAPALEALEPTLRLKAPQPIEGKREPPSPSSTSTPQLSSSDSSSWLSSSQESSSQYSNISNHTPNNTTGIKHSTATTNTIHTTTPSPSLHQEIIRDDTTGLEASVHIEDDTLVVDSVLDVPLTAPTTSGTAYTDLGRFNLALEVEEEREEEEERSNEVNKRGREGKRGQSEEREEKRKGRDTTRGRSEESEDKREYGDNDDEVVAKRPHKNKDKSSKGHQRSSSYTNYIPHPSSLPPPHSLPRASFSHVLPSHYGPTAKQTTPTRETTPTKETTPTRDIVLSSTDKEATPTREETIPTRDIVSNNKETTPTRDIAVNETTSINTINEITPTTKSAVTEAMSDQSHDSHMTNNDTIDTSIASASNTVKEAPPPAPPTPLDEEYSYGDILRLATGLLPNAGKKEKEKVEEINTKVEDTPEIDKDVKEKDEIHVHVKEKEVHVEEPVIATYDTPLNQENVMTTPIDMPTVSSTNPFLEDFIEATPTLALTPSNPFYNNPTHSSEITPNPFDPYLDSAPKLSPILPSKNNPFSFFEEEEQQQGERRDNERQTRNNKVIRERKLQEDENELERIRDETKHRQFEDTLIDDSQNHSLNYNENSNEENEKLTQNDEIFSSSNKNISPTQIISTSNNNNEMCDDNNDTQSDDGFLVSSQELLPPDVMSLHEEHYQQELSMEGIEFQVAQLKSYLRRDSSNLQAQEKLVQLQLLKQEMKEMLESTQSDLLVCGHQLKVLPRGFNTKKCDTCNKPTVGLLKQVLKCQTCGYLTHSKCLSQITQKCLTVTMKEQPKYTMAICPEKGLTPQHFRCSNCNQALNSSVEVRLCDYSGHYYCPECHHNDMTVIPARVLHNWDFSMRRVCSSCFKLLEAMYSRPLINVQLINPQLYTYVHDIRSVEVLRKDIIQMKEFLVKCDRARQEKLIQELNLWPHFKDTSNMFSLSDLIEIQEGNLLSQLQVVHRMFLSHICNECEKCSSRGTECKLCYSRDVLFPFSKEVVVCQACSSLYHRDCLLSENGKKSCPVCAEKKRSSRRIATLWKND